VKNSDDLAPSIPDDTDTQYFNAINVETRKELGQFPTPRYIAQIMSELLDLSDNNLKILDPAIGTGILTNEVIYIVQRENLTNIQVTGFDIADHMIEYCTARFRQVSSDTNILLHCSDFMLVPNQKFDRIIANPPYVKSNRITNKKQYFSLIKQKYQIKLDGTTGLDMVFLLKCIQLLNSNGKLVFILPSEFLNSGYGENIKENLLEQTRIEALVYFDFAELVFDNMSSALLVILSKKKPSITASHKVKFVKIRTINQLSDLKSVIVENKQSDSLFVFEKLQHKLLFQNKWLNYFDESFNEEEFTDFIKLGELFDVTRGIATGANHFFTLTAEEKMEWTIPDKYLKPVLTKAVYAKPPIFTASDFQKLVKSNKKVFLLNITSQYPEEISEYLAYGRQQKVHEKYLTRTRKRWYVMEKRKPASILVKVFQRSEVQFILNKTQVVNLTSFHGLYSIKNTSVYDKPLLLFLNSKIGKKSINLEIRHYGGGLKKMEPRDVEKIKIPELTKLKKSELKSLQQAYDAWTTGTNVEIESLIENLVTTINSRKISNKKGQKLMKYL